MLTHCDSASTLVEPLTECFVLAILGSTIMRQLFSIPAQLFLPAHLITWFSLDILIYQSLSHASPSPSRSHTPSHDGPGFSYFLAWIIRETMAFPIWAFAMLGFTVGWRNDGQTYQVLMDGSVRLAEKGESDGWVEGCMRFARRVVGERRGYDELTLEDPIPSAAKR